MNYSEILKKGEIFLKKGKINNPHLDSELILSKVTNRKREEILLNINNKLTNTDIIKFRKYLLRRYQKEPMAYILGYKHFWKYRFFTNKSVLIPRPDTELLIEHVKNLKQGKSVDKPCYDFKSSRRLEQTEKVNPHPLIIVEGILIFSSEALRKLMDIKIYVDTDADERLMRRIRRDTLERGRALEAILDRYAQSVKPMHMRFVEPSKRWADVIIPRGGGNFVAIDMVLSRIHKMLEAPYEGPGRRHTDKIIRKVIG